MFELDSLKTGGLDDFDRYLGYVVPAGLLAEPLDSVPTQATLVVAPHTSVADVVRAMNEYDTTCAVIVERHGLVAVFTDDDLRRRVLADGEVDLARSIIEVATAPVVTAPHRASVAFALRTMRAANINHLPVTDDRGDVLSLVSVIELGRWLADHLPVRHD